VIQWDGVARHWPCEFFAGSVVLPVAALAGMAAPNTPKPARALMAARLLM